MLWTRTGIAFVVLTSMGEGRSALAEKLPDSKPTGIPGFFVKSRKLGGGYTAHLPGMQVILGQDGVQMTSGAGSIVLHFLDANSQSVIDGCEAGPARINVLHGNASEWQTGLAAFSCVRYRALYPGIDMVYRIEGSRLKSEFIVSPSANPSSIRIQYAGASGIAVDQAGGLLVTAADGEYREGAPYIYQISGSNRAVVPSEYRVAGTTVGFEIGAYDPTRDLIIDPTISFSTYFGGSGDVASAIALDQQGNIYIAGWTESFTLPVQGALQAKNAGGVDAFVAKLDPTGSHLLYCTYLGGNAQDEALGIAVDSGGYAYVTGWTNSANFPVTGQVLLSQSGGGRDAFVAKLDSSGGRLIYSTFLGGGGQDTGAGIAVDASGNAYITGSTTSTNFPTYHAFQASNGGQQDAFAVELNSSGTALLFGTYLGGIGVENANAIALDAAGNMYVAGDTTSLNFPTLNPFQAASGGNQDGFVAKLNPATGSLIYSSYLGGQGGTAGLPESAAAIDVDSSGSAYVAGVTSSPNFPVLGAFQSSPNGSINAFLAKLTPSGNGLVYGTYLGGSSVSVATGVRVDPTGKACVAGYTASQDFQSRVPCKRLTPVATTLFSPASLLPETR